MTTLETTGLVKIDGRPFLIGEKSIDYIRVEPLSFASFTACASKANALGLDGSAWNVQNQRFKMKAQAKFFTKENTEVELTDTAIAQMPIPYAAAIRKLMTATSGPEGKIIGEGDGVSSSIIYELGTPIVLRNNSDETTIRELEFSANTFGDVEEIMAENMLAEQVILMLKLIAKPIGGDINLIALPSWAIDQITMADGTFIMEHIRPRFLE